MTDKTPPGHRQDVEQDTARTVVSVAVAAKRLGITHDAVRKKLQRGTLPGDKSAGEWRVFLPRQDTQGVRQDAEPDDRQDETETRQDTARTPSADVLAGRDALIDQLKSENAFLRDQLDQRSRELGAERERSDVLQQLALNRIPPLASGETRVDQTNEPPSRTDPPAASPQPPGSTETAKTSADTSQSRRSWWRRLFGGG